MRTRIPYRPHNSLPAYFGIPVFLLLISLLGVRNAKAAIELIYFIATPGVEEILLEWETATEFDNLGFFILRSTAEGGEFDPISPFIEAGEGGVTGAEYAYTDGDVTSGLTYFYKLEAINLNQVSEFYISDPPFLSALTNTPSATPTATNTPTSTSTASNTPTNTATPSATSSTLTSSTTPTKTTSPTPTRTLIPSRTPFGSPIPPTNTQSILPTHTSNPTNPSTATSIPSATPESLPTIESLGTPPNTNILPTLPPPTTMAGQGQAQDESNVSVIDSEELGSMFRIAGIIVVFVVWGLLAGGVYYFITHRKQ